MHLPTESTLVTASNGAPKPEYVGRVGEQACALVSERVDNTTQTLGESSDDKQIFNKCKN
jgi:hypothetical protein